MSGFVAADHLVVRTGPKAVSPKVRLDYRRFGANGVHVSENGHYRQLASDVVRAHERMLEGTSHDLRDGSVVMTGWKTESPFVSSGELDAIATAAAKLAGEIDDCVSMGIGGSFLGIDAGISAIKGSLDLTNLLSREERGGAPRFFFLGHNMDPRSVATTLQIMKGRSVGGIVISKSGGTVEPAIAFAVFKDLMERSYGAEAARRIVAITDKSRGALKQLADQMGYEKFIVPDNVGGRYSVTSPVGLFALAVAGVDIKQFIAGTRAAEEDTRNNPFDKNIAMLRAVMRYIAYRCLKRVTELASTGTYDLRSTTMWMQQLGPESEGKFGEGLFIVPQFYTRDAHADGQMTQEGSLSENAIETFLMVEDPGIDITIPGKGTPVSYLDGKPLSFANQAFLDGLRDSHFKGGVPTMSYVLSHLDAFMMGMLYQYEMNAIALSGLLLGQNPFIQPGVQAYKKVADARSGKPGTEAELARMLEEESKLNPEFVV